MKKSLLLISLCVLAISASAQFKVQSDGKIAIQTTSTPVSSIAINSAGSSSYYMYCNAGVKNGFYLQAMGNGSGTNLGLRGHAENADVSIGVLGDAGSTTKALGIVGSIGNTSTGAGIYGTIYSGYGTGINSGEKYAGFFYGNVKVTGNVIANNIASKTLLGESASGSDPSANSLSLKLASVATSLSGLNVTTYQKERPAPPEDMETIYDNLDGDTLQRGEEPEPDIIDVQYYEKTHYALDADRLEEAFPDLVYEREDGSKAINYMEMIPLLVQSINELNAKIEVLEGQTSEGAVKAARSTTNIQNSSLHQNKLYQNTPNPFKEQTIIRFSLADDVQDASICIFDMTGKTIKKLPVSSGMESVSIGGYELGEGMFLYSLVVNGQEIDTKKMIISK